MSLDKNRIGLSLSGGGYRAAAFHLGTLKKLDELGILQKIDVVSTISGGSIIGAAWCLHKSDYKSFHQAMINALGTKSVIKYVLSSWIFLLNMLCIVSFFFSLIFLTFTRLSALIFPLLIIFFFVLLKFQFLLFPISKIIEAAYNKFFYQKKTLKDLIAKPTLAISSSNLHTGRLFTFSKFKMSDSSYLFRYEYNPGIEFKHLNFPVARAVMASSCVPFAFTPVTIDKEFFVNENDFNRIKPMLIDGGVYDNQGIQKLTQSKSSYECDVIITSDAGGNFAADKKYPNTLTLLTRTVDLFMYRIKAFQMIQNVYKNVDSAGRPIAYFSLGWEIQNLIPGFVQNLINGLVLKEVIHAHSMQESWLDNPKSHFNEIVSHLKKKISYDEIEKRNLSKTQWDIARNTSTNLKCLSKNQIEFLIRHAENLTEIQIKLYCPLLLPDNETQNHKLNR